MLSSAVSTRMSQRRGGSQVQVQAAPMDAAHPQGGSTNINDVCRMTFLQALMAASYVQEDRAKQTLRSILNVQDDSLFSKTIKEINAQLQFAQFKLKTVKSPVDELRYIGFVNTLADTSSKLGTKYTIPQRDFFKATMEAIATSPQLSDGKPAAPRASEIHILNMDPPPRASQAGAATQAAGPASQAAGVGGVAAGKKLTKYEKQSALQQLVADGWLASPPGQAGYYCLGPRTFLELGHYLLSLELGEETRKAWEEIV